MDAMGLLPTAMQTDVKSCTTAGGEPQERGREGGRNQGLRGKEGKKIRETKLVC